MKKTKINKTIAAVTAALLCMGVSVAPTLAKKPDNGGESDIISPQNIAVSAIDNRLTVDDYGKSTCYGKTSVQYGYIAGITVELQQYNGGWSTIQTWNNSGGTTSSIREDWYVEKGYSYRLKLTHKAYNSSWTQIESFNKYSNVVYY